MVLQYHSAYGQGTSHGTNATHCLHVHATSLPQSRPRPLPQSAAPSCLTNSLQAALQWKKGARCAHRSSRPGQPARAAAGTLTTVNCQLDVARRQHGAARRRTYVYPEERKGPQSKRLRSSRAHGGNRHTTPVYARYLATSCRPSRDALPTPRLPAALYRSLSMLVSAALAAKAKAVRTCTHLSIRYTITVREDLTHPTPAYSYNTAWLWPPLAAGLHGPCRPDRPTSSCVQRCCGCAGAQG